MTSDDRVAPSFSEPTLQVLRRALQRLEHLEFDDRIGMFSAVRAAIDAIAPVDAFYVGIYQGRNGVIIPYTYYHGRFVRSDYSHFRGNGLSAWLKAHAVTYLYGQDGGKLLAYGMPIGKGNLPTLDAVVVPIPGRDEPVGMISVQSEQPSAYNREHIDAIEWLAAALARFMRRREELSFDFEVLQTYPELDPATEDEALQTFHEIARRLGEIHESAERLRANIRPDNLAVQALADEHVELCVRHEAELALLLGGRTTVSAHPPGWSSLTERQREIADLVIDEGATNATIAERLRISEATVKSHLRQVFRTLDMSGREELRQRATSQ